MSVPRDGDAFKNEIIVIDNGSSDGTIEMLSNEFPHVNIIRNQNNIGVARARNQGIRAAGGDYILMLDSDTEIKNNALEILLNFIKSNKDIAVAGPKLLYPNGSDRKSVV